MSEASTIADEPIYTAVYRHGLDGKRRLQIPSKWRASGKELELVMILWPNGFDKNGCLMVVPKRVVHGFMASLNQKPFGDPEANVMRRFIGERSDIVVLDSAGRICVPDHMSRAVGIGKEAVLVGLLDRFQIWGPAKYEATTPGVEAVAANVWQQF